MDLTTLAGSLRARRPTTVLTGAPPGRGDSAVLVPLYEHRGELHVVLTRRAAHLRHHTGEVSFPGGRRDPGETLWETAIREANEETGLDPETVTPLGEMDRLRTVTSDVAIHPFVALIDRVPDLVANPHEVAAIIEVPLSELMSAEVYRQELWAWEHTAQHQPMHFFELASDTVWGATARMLHQLLLIGLDLE